MAQRYPTLSIVGAGTVGSTLGLALRAKGYPVAAVISRTGPSALALARALKCSRASTAVADLPAETELLLLAVPDAAVAQVAREAAALKQLKFRKLFAVHCSGVHSASVLAPLRKKGAAVASMHPVQTFPSRLTPAELRGRLKGIYYGIDGEALSLRKAENLAADLGGHAVEVPEELRALYHATCVFASSYLMVLLNAISELARALPLKASWTEVFGPLMTASMEHTIRQGASRSLTGPIVRGDDPTIDAHLAALAEHAPQFLPLYTVAGIEVARVARKGGQISEEDVRRLVMKFRQFIKSQPTRKVNS